MRSSCLGVVDSQLISVLTVWVFLFRNDAGPPLYEYVKDTLSENRLLRFTYLPFTEIEEDGDNYIGIYVIVFGGYFVYVGKTEKGFWSRRLAHRGTADKGTNCKIAAVKDDEGIPRSAWQHGIALGYGQTSGYRGRVIAGLET